MARPGRIDLGGTASTAIEEARNGDQPQQGLPDLMQSITSGGAELDSAVYVYGVLTATELASLSVEGVHGVPVRAVEHDGLAALTSELKSDALAAARQVRSHWRVLDEAAKTATVLPARCGTVLESNDAVRERLLEPNRDRLAGLLGTLAGRVQLNVEGEYDEDKLTRAVVSESPAIVALREKVRTLPDAAGYYDRIRLGELEAGEVERRRGVHTQFALETLGPLAVESRREPASNPNTAYRLAFLVERDRQDEFTAAVNVLSAAHGDEIAIRCVGPLPPYSFVDADLMPRSET